MEIDDLIRQILRRNIGQYYDDSVMVHPDIGEIRFSSMPGETSDQLRLFSLLRKLYRLPGHWGGQL